LAKISFFHGEPNAAKNFEVHIKSMAVEIAAEIGLCGRLDVVRLKVAAKYIESPTMNVIIAK